MDSIPGLMLLLKTVLVLVRVSTVRNVFVIKHKGARVHAHTIDRESLSGLVTTVSPTGKYIQSQHFQVTPFALQQRLTTVKHLRVEQTDLRSSSFTFPIQ